MPEHIASEEEKRSTGSVDKDLRNSDDFYNEPAIMENAKRVLDRRYLKRDDSGKVIETPKEMIIRVAKAIAFAERNYGASNDEVSAIEKKFYDMISSLDFVPNSPTLMNAGRELGQLSACFVLPVDDSIEAIFDAIKYTALIHKSGGGCASGESRVFTTFCGLERFETIYERLREEGLEENEYDENGVWMDVEGRDIRCLSFDQVSGRFEFRKVEKVWKYDMSRDDCVTMRTANGTEVTTSCWHPFLVRGDSGILERRADELRIGDELIAPRIDITDRWPFDENRRPECISINESIAWLLGYLSGLTGRDRTDINEIDNGMSVSSAADYIFETALSGVSIGPKEVDSLDPKERLLLLLALNEQVFGVRNASVFPHEISKSSKEVLVSYIAGIIDSAAKRDKLKKLEISISGEGQAKDIASLLSLMGATPVVHMNDGCVNLEIQKSAIPHLASLLLNRSKRMFTSSGKETFVKDIADGASEEYGFMKIAKVSRCNGDEHFYDFTVEGTNNYLAGEFGMTVIHNTGFSFSRLRPAKDAVMSTKGISSGPISFMEVFNAATETIKQGGTRRGANMGILRVDHPDILEFITSKRDQKRLTNFNISVALTDKFMKAVKEKGEYDLVNPRSDKVEKPLDANTVFDLIVNMAWRNGEPGIVFIDRINRDNPTPEIGQIESTNPCGEQPLLPFESCNLGSINLYHMLKRDESGWSIDWDRLKDAIIWSIRFLDDVIDVNKYPLPQIEEMTKANRKIGLGVMGFADMLLRLGIPYDSNEALEVGRNIMKFIHSVAREASQKLAEARGSFSNFPKSTLRGKYPMMRNATVTTIAPTGTISIIAGSSSGIEPMFAIAYTRNVMDRDELYEINPIFEEISKKRGFYSEELMKRVAEEGSISEMREIPEDVRRLFITSHDIPPEVHVRMQAAFQEFTDNAVSKTVNFPKDATPEDVRKVYIMSYDLGLKGVTVYRYGSRDEQVLNLGKGVEQMMGIESNQTGYEEHPLKGDASPTTRSPRPRPPVTRGTTHKMETGCGKLYVTINEDEHGLCEVFTQMGKSGGCTASQSEAIGRLISLALRSGIDVKTVIKQLRGIRCPTPLWQPGGMVLSCSDAIAKALERYVESRELPPNMGEPAVVQKQNHVDRGEVCPECPDCGAMVDYVEGCVVCRSCGYSRCW